MDLTISFGRWVKQRRVALDLTQGDLARLVGCARVTMQKIEADERRPSRQIAARLADQLQLVGAERAAFIAAARTPASTIDLTARRQPSSDIPASAALTSRPSGTVTFLFTDIAGSTWLWEQHPDLMSACCRRHEAILREAIATCGGYLYKMIGDACQAAFTTAHAALAAAIAAQRMLNAEDWGALGPLPVRMALDSGVVEERGDGYVGPLLNRLTQLRAAAYGGQILLSAAIKELLWNHLPPDVILRDLGVHQLKDLLRPEPVYQVVASDLPADFPPLNTLDLHPSNLPAQLTPLVGREHAVEQICGLLQRADVRLVTLTGPGGIGKTRLGLQAAAGLLETFVDGVCFVDLAPISDPALVILTVAGMLGLKEAAGQPLGESLKIYLHEKHMLLLLDNFEQVVAATTAVAELLKAAPRLKVLVTSRTRLHLSGEQEFAVPPLTIPDPQHLPAVEQLRQYEAVALFIARAGAVKADFQVTNASAPAVAEICHRLDGLPLAIELAAARIKLFTPEELLARLDHRLALLTGGPRDLPTRQQTLRNTIDWSYHLLDQSEQTLFMRLAVFVGGWTFHAAEAVCDPADDLGIVVLDGLQSLLDQSLLRQVAEPDGTPRLVMLETIREYALERFDAGWEAESLRQRHATYFLTLVEQVEPKLRGVGQARWLARLEAEYDNLRAALGWAAQRANVELGARLAGALWRFWEARGLWSEGWARLAEIFPETPADALPRTAVWAKMLQGRAVLAFYLGDHAAARQLFEHSLARFRELKDQSGIAWTLIYYGWQINDGGDPLGARPLFEESLTIFRHLGDQQGMGWALARLGLVYLFLGDLPAARPLLEESLALCRAVGDRWGTAWSLQLLGVVVGELGDPAAAIALEAESLAISRALGDRRNMAYTQAFLGAYLTLDQGEHAEAQRLIAEALRGQHELGDHWGMALVLWFAAIVSAARGLAARAVRLESASGALIEAIGAALPLAASPRFMQILQVSRQALSEEERARAWAEGRAMTQEQAIAYACDEVD